MKRCRESQRIPRDPKRKDNGKNHNESPTASKSRYFVSQSMGPFSLLSVILIDLLNDPTFILVDQSVNSPDIRFGHWNVETFKGGTLFIQLWGFHIVIALYQKSSTPLARKSNTTNPLYHTKEWSDPKAESVARFSGVSRDRMYVYGMVPSVGMQMPFKRAWCYRS